MNVPLCVKHNSTISHSHSLSSENGSGGSVERSQAILRLFGQEALADHAAAVLGRVDVGAKEVRWVLGWQLNTTSGLAALGRALRAPERQARLGAALVAADVVDSLSWRRDKRAASPLLDALERAEAAETDAGVRAAIVAARDAWKTR